MPSSCHLWLCACFHLTSGDGCRTTDARSYGTRDALCSGTANEGTLEDSRLAIGLQLHDLVESHQHGGGLRSQDQAPVCDFGTADWLCLFSAVARLHYPHDTGRLV